MEEQAASPRRRPGALCLGALSLQDEEVAVETPHNMFMTMQNQIVSPMSLGWLS